MRKIFIGYDSTEPIAWDVCRYSIERNSLFGVDEIHRLTGEPGGWRRAASGGQSTEFTYSRFLVPYLSGYQGISLFVDCDFLFLDDVNLLTHYLRGASVACCQHPDYAPRSTDKMDGQTQVAYPRKNWSSLMLFDNAKCRALTPEYVANASPQELHRMRWANSIDSIPLEWNTLEGYYHFEQPKAIHYTDGGPWHNTYRNSRYAQLWKDYYREWCDTFKINSSSHV